MVDSINRLNGVKEIKPPELKATAANDQKVGGFGFGFPNNNNSGTTVEREIPGLEALKNTFTNVDFLPYKKNVPPLEISDEYLIYDNYTDELCEA